MWCGVVMFVQWCVAGACSVVRYGNPSDVLRYSNPYAVVRYGNPGRVVRYGHACGVVHDTFRWLYGIMTD